MENISQMSMLEVACTLMEHKRNAQPIRKLIREVLEIKGIDDLDSSLSTQLYIDITTSSKFVYMGNEEWDLKSRQSLDEYDKDGSAFNSKEDIIEDEEVRRVIPVDNIEDEEEEEYYDDDIKITLPDEDEEDLSIDDDEIDDDDEVDYDSVEEDEDEDDDDFMGEDKYNKYMDDYEDMYDEE